MRRIEAFCDNVSGLTFEDITIGWLSRFEDFCARTACKNARNIHLRNIRAVFNHALDNGITTAYPFRRYKIRPEKTRKRSLPADDLRRLMTMEVEPYAELYRDMFVLSLMLCGINAVDLYGLKEVTADGRVEYRRAKTGRLYSIRVEPEAMAIIDRWRGKTALLCLADRWGDHRNFIRQCNKALSLIGADKDKGGMLKGGGYKREGGKAKGIWPGLTTYWARHSWATVAYSIGVSKDIIAQGLGHSDGHDTTDIYIDFDRAKVDEANRRVLDFLTKG